MDSVLDAVCAGSKRSIYLHEASNFQPGRVVHRDRDRVLRELRCEPGETDAMVSSAF